MRPRLALFNERQDETQAGAEARRQAGEWIRQTATQATADRRFCDAVGIRKAQRHDGDTVNEMDNTLEHDDQAIVGALRGYIAEIKQLDAEGAAIDRRRRDLYREAAEYGFNSGILKNPARPRRKRTSRSNIFASSAARRRPTKWSRARALVKSPSGHARPGRAINISSHVRNATKSDDRLSNCDPSLRAISRPHLRRSRIRSPPHDHKIEIASLC